MGSHTYASAVLPRISSRVCCRIVPFEAFQMKPLEAAAVQYIALPVRTSAYISMALKVFTIQVSGIKCTNCAGKIKKALASSIPQITKTTVNVIQQKVYVTLDNDLLLIRINQCLNQIGFPALGEPVLVAGGADTDRSLHFIFQSLPNEDQVSIIGKIGSLAGVNKCLRDGVPANNDMSESLDVTAAASSECKVSVQYNCEILKGRQIIDEVEAINATFSIWNERVDGARNQPRIVENRRELYECIGLVSYFLLFNMILPETGSWFASVMLFPDSFGLFSLLMLFNIALTIYTIKKFGKGFVVNSYVNYRDYRAMNMETLVALGSMSAFALFLFFLVRYTLQMLTGELNDKMMAMMVLNDALTSSTLIILIVTVGKFLQRKVKKKIETMTEEIFPESQLFQDMKINYVQLKNRRLMIEREKVYNVDAIEKNDIIRLKPGRLLLDVIIFSGTTKAIESVMNGSEDSKQYQKGDRLRSGSVISETDSLAQVENVFEKSVLLEIGSQINMANNNEQSSQIGIQAVCKKISSHFVKGVICLSSLVIITWSILLSFKIVEVSDCSICWIVERGVGVLVASCPCALGLAVPSVIAIALNLAIKSGILVRKNTVFEKSKTCQVVAFDKTGTLFTKVEKIDQFHLFTSQFTAKELWEMVALLEKEFRHPLAELLYKQALNRSEVQGTNFNYISLEKPLLDKEGIAGTISSKANNKILSIKIGNRKLLQKNHIEVPKFTTTSDAATCIYVSVNSVACMVTLLNTHSNLRPEAIEIVSQLQGMGKEVHILSGDSSESVEKLSMLLNIPFQCQHPEQSAVMKMEWIKSMQKDGKRGVMMIGDGLNDIPCLQEAAIGVSINAKSELNLNAADVIILSENLYKIVALFKLLKRSNHFINMNLFWSFSYNICILPIVAGAFYSFDIDISPVWSSIAMSISSLVVVSFSHLLVCFTYDQSLSAETNKSVSDSPRRSSENEKMLIEMVNTHKGSEDRRSTKYSTLEEEV